MQESRWTPFTRKQWQGELKTITNSKPNSASTLSEALNYEHALLYRLNRTLWDYVEEILTKHRSKIEWIAPWIAPLAGYSTRLEKAMTSLGLLPEDDFLPSDDSIKVI